MWAKPLDRIHSIFSAFNGKFALPSTLQRTKSFAVIRSVSRIFLENRGTKVIFLKFIVKMAPDEDIIIAGAMYIIISEAEAEAVEEPPKNDENGAGGQYHCSKAEMEYGMF